jgi:hypothetical protein
MRTRKSARAIASGMPAVLLFNTSSIVDTKREIVHTDTTLSIASTEFSRLVLAAIASYLYQLCVRPLTVALVPLSILNTFGSIQANVLILATGVNFDLASMANKAIWAYTVLKVFIVSHVKIRRYGSEIKLVQKANILGSLATFSTVQAFKSTLLIAFVIL